MALQVIPSVDLRAGRVVRLMQGDYGQQINYDVDPIATAVSYRQAGAQWFHIVDLDGAKQGRPVQTELIAQLIQASGLNVQVGGGIRQRSDIDILLAAGAARVVIGTQAMENWTWFEDLLRDPAMHQKIVLALDAKNGVVATRGWTASAGRLAVDVAALVSDWPLAGILYTDVARDGMLSGPNFEQTQKLAQAGKVPVIASGGVGSIDHIRTLTGLGVWGVIVGRSLYEGKLDLKAAIQVAAAEPPRQRS